MSNTPLLDAFLAFSSNEKLPFFVPKTDYAVSAINYLPKNPLIKKEDFVWLGFEPDYKLSFYIWKIRPNENLENQPIALMYDGYQMPLLGVVAQNLREFLSMLAFPQSMRTGLGKTYIYHDKTKNKSFEELFTGQKLEWELGQYLDKDKKNEQTATNDFLAFLEKNQIPICEDIYKTIFEAVNSFEHLDSSFYIHQLTKNFPNMYMPDLIRDFYTLLEEHHISLPEFEDDRGTHFSQSGMTPHFVSADLIHNFIKIGLTGSGGYYAIWLVFPDKKVEENPVLLLDSEASPVAVVASNFQEYISIAWTNIYAIISNIEFDATAGNEIQDIDKAQIAEYLEAFKEDNKADEYENLPERASIYFDFVAKNTPDVQEKNPFQIIKNAYLTMPNLLDWLKKEMPGLWN